MRHALTALSLSLLLAACSSAPVRRAHPVSSGDSRIFRDGSDLSLLRGAEAKASPAGAKILASARVLTVEQRKILPGACWDYVNCVWDKAGYPDKRRQTVFKGGKKGPYAKAGDIQPGDWLYFINHSYGDIEHSALFVDWADKGALSAYMLSYTGEKRAEPARYLLYDLSSVYRVIRGKD